MLFNGSAINSSAPINGGVSSASVATAPINNTYLAEVLEKTNFPSFVSFATPPITLVGVIEPANTTIRLAFRFSAGGPIRIFTGTDWQALVGDGITNGMTATNVGNLTAANMIATGGFDTGVPYLQVIVYMRTTNTSSVPSLSGVTISFIQGTGSLIIWSNNLSSDVPVQGSVTPVPAGTYIWDLNGGYRLEDGITDTGNAIPYSFETQDFIGSDNMESFLHAIEIDVENNFNGQIMNVRATSDDNVIQNSSVTLSTGRRVVSVPVRKQNSALTHRARVSWAGNNLTIHKVGLVYEMSGRSRA